MWPFKKKRIKIYINERPLDKVVHQFECYYGIFVVMASGEAYLIKGDFIKEDYKIMSLSRISR